MTRGRRNPTSQNKASKAVSQKTAFLGSPIQSLESKSTLSLCYKLVLKSFEQSYTADQEKQANMFKIIGDGDSAPSLSEYITRLHTYLGECPNVFLVANHVIMNIDKILPFTPLTSHKILLGCFTISMKWLLDDVPSQGYLAKVGGVEREDLDGYEHVLLKHLGHHIIPIGLNEIELKNMVTSWTGVVFY